MSALIRADLAQISVYKAETHTTNQAPDQTDKLDANEVAVDLPDWFKQKIAARAQTEILGNRYPDGEYLSLKKIIATYAGVEPEQISLGNGSDELIRSLLIATCLNNSGLNNSGLNNSGSILVAEPTFSMYGILAQGLGIPVVKIQRHEQDFSIDLDAAAAAVATGKIKAVCLVHPNSPTGNILNAAELDWIKSLPSDILVVIDEAYFEFSGQTLAGELFLHPNWLILRTFSKAFRLAAYRVGYAITSPELNSALEKIRLPYNLPTISAYAAELAIIHSQELLANIPEIIAEREKILAEVLALDSAKIRAWSSAANFLYLRSSRDAELCAHLKSLGTILRQTGGGLRLTIGTCDQNLRALTRLKDFIGIDLS